MYGFQEDTIPFQASITFFRENDKPFPPIGDIVYPITEKNDTFLETSAQYHLNKLTKYYDTETKEFKFQPICILSKAKQNYINKKLHNVIQNMKRFCHI